MRSLGVLQRLAKQAVDRERQALQAISAEIADVEGEIEGLRHMIEREAAAAPDFMTSGVTLAAFIKAKKQRIQSLKARRCELEEAYDAQMDRVQERRVEEKRYARLAERRAEEAIKKAAMKEQRTIDELVTIGGRRD